MRIGFILLASTLAAQTTPPEVRVRTSPYFPPGPLISVESNLVELTATVTDGQGRLVSGLTRDDFELLDNRVSQGIASFIE